MIMRTIVALSLLATCAMFGEEDSAKCGCGKPPVPREAAEVAGSVTTNQECGCGKPPVTGREVTAPSTNQECGCGKPPVSREAVENVAAVSAVQNCGCGKPPVTGREVTAPSTNQDCGCGKPPVTGRDAAAVVNQDANEKCPCGQPKPREGSDVVFVPRDVPQNAAADNAVQSEAPRCCEKSAHAGMPCNDCVEKAACSAK